MGLTAAAFAGDRYSRCRYRSYSGWTVHASLATPSAFTTNLFVSGAGMHHGSWYYGNSVSDIYADYRGLTLSAGTFSLGGTYKFNRWFALGADVDMSFLWQERFSAISDESLGIHNGVALMLVPKAMVYYVDRPSWRLYGYLGVGVAKYFGFDRLYGNNDGRSGGSPEFWDKSLRSVWQWTPIGIEFGRWIYGFAELGIGNEYTGARAGIGFRF